MPGFLVPDTYVVVPPSFDDLLVASIIWGCTLATGVFSCTKAVQQTRALWKRSQRIQPYVIMVWAEWIVNMVIGVLSWVFLRGLIQPRFVERIPLYCPGTLEELTSCCAAFGFTSFFV
jgi:hypothetical protein